MRRVLSIIAMMGFLFFLSWSVNMAQDKSLRLNRLEMESLLSSFNQASFRGAEIEGLAPLAQKLREGARQLESFGDSPRTILLRVTPREARICLEMIEQANLQERHAEIIKRVKLKLLHQV